MAKDELTLRIFSDGKILALTQGGSEKESRAEMDNLRLRTIRIFEKWLNEPKKISHRSEFEVLGMHLYQVLFHGDIGSFFKQTLGKVPKGERLRLQLSFQGEDNKLANLPWEFLYYPGTETDRGFFFSTEVNLVLSRYMPLEQDREPLKPEETPLRILIVVSKPEDVGPVVDEPAIEAIQKLAEKYPIKIDILDKPTVDKFVEKLEEKEKPHVLHFIGHGRFIEEKEGERRGEIALLKPDEKSAIWIKDSDFVGYFVQMQAIPRLVFLHLCEGGKVDFKANFAGLAPQLIRANVQAVVAMQYPITNRAALTFSRAFYSELLKGQPIDNAVQVGRWSLTKDPDISYDDRVFGTPVMYMRSYDGIIQPTGETGTEGKRI